MTDRHQARALLAVLLAAICFGTTGTAQSLGAQGASPLSLGAARIVLGGGLLAAIAWAGRLRRARHAGVCPGTDPRVFGVVGAATGHARHLTRPRMALTIVLGAAGVLGYQASFFAGTKTNGVAVGTLIALGSAPIVTGAVTWLVERAFPGRRWLVATGGAIVGVGLLSGVGQLSAQPLQPLGVLASLAAGACYAASTLASKRLLDAGFSSSGAMGAVFGAGAVGAAIVLPFTDLTWLATGRGVATVLWLGVVATAVAYTAFGYGLARLSAPLVASLTLGEPLVATLLGALVLAERLTGAQVGGAIVLLGALLLLALPSGRRWRRNRHAPGASP